MAVTWTERMQNRRELFELIRKGQGKYFKDEIVKIVLDKLDSGEYHVVLDDLFPKAEKQELQAAISQINGDGKYMLDKNPYDSKWVIRRNPNFELGESVKSTNSTQRLILWVMAIFAALQLSVSYCDYKKPPPNVEGAESTRTLPKLPPQEKPLTPYKRDSQ